jgi:DNA-binding transcriptional MerR regulator
MDYSIPIGRFAQITRLTIKALHIYDAMGLLRPVFVDPDTGYRYYSITQLPLARRIRLLRSIDMPLESIHAVVHAPSAASMEGLLHEHQQRIAARVARDQQALYLLQQLIDHQEDDLAFTVQTKWRPEHLIAAIRLRTTPADESRVIPDLIDELQTFVRDVRRPGEPAIRISHEYSDESVDTEIAIPITQAVPETERVRCRVLEGSQVAYVIHVGPHADLWAVYWAILVWIEERGYQQSGPPREVYWKHPTAGSEPGYRTEIQWPIISRQ